MGSLDYHKREYLKKAAKIHTTSMRSETLLDVAWSDAQRASLEYFRHQWRSVKKYCFISVKNKTLFERSEFVLFRKWKNILASQRKPAFFLCFVSFVRTKEMKIL